MQDLTTKPRYLVTFTVGFDQKKNIDAAVKKVGPLWLFFSFFFFLFVCVILSTSYTDFPFTVFREFHHCLVSL